MSIRRIYAALSASLLILSCNTMNAFADTTLPEGAVKGLPEKLTAMDSEGRAVNSESGEYFFCVDDMIYGETYSKDVQLMNLRDDQAYNIYLHTEPVSRSGDIDLEKGCVCKFYLDGREVYSGDVNGKGNIDLTQDALDLGNYKPGDSHTLKCSVVWNDTSYVDSVKSSHRIVSRNGTEVLEESNNSAYGDIVFKWIFYAAVDEDFVPPNTGLFAVNGRIWLCCMAAVATMILFMLPLLLKQKRKKREA
ncbi:MAG: hypothetical protein K5898_11750 [Ruminococcus sp.]|uniref:hypothetical protein n=1 Tax=Ruminococcus sp. TaxID=41978 RepID=UPI0025ED89E4|nr:hypothetical protein [Ruminococcus sp.]MCR4795813.1 hypothetical protein [Ruminococcus sp.]